MARKMSWASRRVTTRLEDMAYCLLGIFDVNMPLIYGEGRKAFLRLQQEIMKSTIDHSLFAWGKVVHETSERCSKDQVLGLEPIEWKPPEMRLQHMGLLAESPTYFKDCEAHTLPDSSSVFIENQRRHTPVPFMMDSGVSISLNVHGASRCFIDYWDEPRTVQLRTELIAILFCHSSQEARYFIGLPLRNWGDRGSYYRTPELVRVDISEIDVDPSKFEKTLVKMHVKAPVRVRLGHGDIVFRRMFTGLQTSRICCEGIKPRVGYQLLQMDKARQDAVWASAISDGSHSFSVTLRRSIDQRGLLCMEVSPFGPARHTATEIMVPIYHGTLTSHPDYHHVMASPFDSWAFCGRGRLRIFFKAQKMSVGVSAGEGEVDVVDIIIPTAEEDIQRMVDQWDPRTR